MKKKTSIMFPHLLAGSVILTCMILAYPWKFTRRDMLRLLARLDAEQKVEIGLITYDIEITGQST